jgi:predicted peptidase
VKSIFQVLLLALAIGIPEGHLAQTPPGQIPLFRPGIRTEIFRRTNDLSLRYTISIPQGYSNTEPVPLILALHFGGSPNGAGQSLVVTLAQPGLGELGAILIAPESLGGGWNSAANERAVLALLDAVKATYRIDDRKTAVMGYSMGGTGAWVFAAKYPNLFRVAIPVAGVPPSSMENWKTPVFAVHSTTDEVNSIEPTARRITELQKAGVRAELVVLTGISHGQTQRFAPGLRKVVPWIKDAWK